MDADYMILDEVIMNRRFALRSGNLIPDRLEKSPNITECDSLSKHLQIHYAPQDETVLPFIRASLSEAYNVVKSWFGMQDDLPIALWMAPEENDLQYMVCIPCAGSYFFAPGKRDGMSVITFVSPLSCQINKDKIRMTSLLAHEISHHVIQDISNASVDSTTRKENMDVPMWLEEGLCQYLQCEVQPSFDKKLTDNMSAISEKRDLEDLWNDLTCRDNPDATDAAYVQAYCAVKWLVQEKGKAEILRLLSSNRDHTTDWKALTKLANSIQKKDCARSMVS